MKKAVCYIRVSTEEQARGGVSLDAQEERLRAYCAMAGLEIVELIREEGVSGAKPLATRPGGERLLELVRRYKCDVVAFKLDRLFRDAEDALHETKAWDAAGVALHYLIAERTAMALQHKKAHLEAYSPTPYGYDRIGDDLVPNDDEQAVIEHIFSWRRAGWSLRRIAGRLNAMGVATKQSGKWYASTVNYILQNELHEGVA